MRQQSQIELGNELSTFPVDSQFRTPPRDGGPIFVQVPPGSPEHVASQRALEFEAGHDGFKGATFSSAVFNLVTTVVGAGIMGLPATMKAFGLPLGVIVLIAMGVLTEISIEILLKTSTIQKLWSYSSLVLHDVGPIARLVLDICIFVNNFGLCIVYLIIIADVLSGTWTGNGVYHPGLFVEWNGNVSAWWNSRYFVVFLVMIFVLVPLACLKHVDSLHYSSAISVLLAIVFVLITLVLTIVRLANGQVAAPRWLPNFSSGQAVAAFFSVIPVMATAYVCHFNVHPIYVELRDRTEATMTSITRSSLIICTSIYLITAISGYLLFGDLTAPDVLANFDNELAGVSPAVNDMIRVSYAIHVILVFPVIYYSLRNITDELLFPAAPLALAKDNRRFFAITGVELVIIYIGSVFVPNIWAAFDLTGATSTMMIGLVFPALVALKDRSGVIVKWERITSYVMIVLAVIVSVTSLSSTIYWLATSQKGQPGNDQSGT